MTERKLKNGVRKRTRRTSVASAHRPVPVALVTEDPTVQPQRTGCVKRPRRMTLARARRHARKLERLARKARATFEGAGSTAERFAAGVALFEADEAVLRSYSARFLAALEAIGDFGPGEVDCSPAELAERIDVFAPCDEPVTLSLKRKPDGRFRPILNFGVEQRARQILIRNLISAQFGERHWDQKLFNGGTKAAIEQVKANYEDGYQCACHLDVVGCFSSFNVEKVAELLFLPEEVARHVLTGQNHAIELSPTNTGEDVPVNSAGPRNLEEVMEQARRGLSTGSKVSPLIADVMLTLVHIALVDCGDIKVTSFADNFIVQARDRATLRNIVHSLRDALHKHPAGPLREHKVETQLMPFDTFEFLGYRLEPDGSRLVASMSEDNAEKARRLRADCYQRLRRAQCETEIAELVFELNSTHRALVNGFHAWPSRNLFHSRKMRNVRAFATRHVEQLANGRPQ